MKKLPADQVMCYAIKLRTNTELRSDSSQGGSMTDVWHDLRLAFGSSEDFTPEQKIDVLVQMVVI